MRVWFPKKLNGSWLRAPSGPRKAWAECPSQDALSIGSCSAVDCCPPPGSTSTERLIFGFPLPISRCGAHQGLVPLRKTKIRLPGKWPSSPTGPNGNFAETAWQNPWFNAMLMSGQCKCSRNQFQSAPFHMETWLHSKTERICQGIVFSHQFIKFNRFYSEIHYFIIQ